MHPPALTAGQKFKLAIQYFDPYTFAFVAAEAGINQAFDSPKEYGQGAEAYGKRYGAGFADGLTNSTFVTGLYPSLLRQDPRYYRRGSGGFFNRATYAASCVLVRGAGFAAERVQCFRNPGQSDVGVPRNHVLPRQPEEFFQCCAARGGQLGFDAGCDLLKEFYPEIERKLFVRKSQSSPKN